jgi:hypothetical protein
MKNLLYASSVFIAVLALGVWGSNAAWAQGMKTETDSTCAVVKTAEYDPMTGTVRVRGSSKTAITLLILDENGDVLVTATRATRGHWDVEFDIVDKTDLPGLVQVEGPGDCVATRRVKTGSLAALDWPRRAGPKR